MVKLKSLFFNLVLGQDETFDSQVSQQSLNTEGGDSVLSSVSSKDTKDDKQVIDEQTDIDQDDTISLEAEQSMLRKLYWKVDLRIIPALWVLYFMTSYGGGAYGNALTMNKDVGHSIPTWLNLTSHDISVSSSLDTVGFIIFDLPMNLCFTYIAARAWISRMVITVGLVSACIVAVKSAPGLQALKFFSGVAGAGIWPGMTYYVSMFYPNEMLSQRIGYYFTAVQISCAVAGLLAGAFQKMDMVRGYTGYQWNFLIYGVITIFIGILLIFWLPNRPRGQKMWPLTKEENKLLQRELARQHKVPARWTWKQFLNVLLDVRIWPLILMYFGVVGAGIGIENYATTLLAEINPSWSDIDLSLLTAPIWLFDFGGILTITPISDRWPQHRVLVFCCSTSIIICGLFVTTYAPNGWSQWSGLLLCGYGLGSSVPICMSLGATIFYERHGDIGVAMVSALISGVGNTGSVATSYALYSGWPEDAARKFEYSNMVMVAILGMSIFAAISLTLLRSALGDFGQRSLFDVTCLNWFRGKSAHRSY